VGQPFGDDQNLLKKFAARRSSKSANSGTSMSSRRWRRRKRPAADRRDCDKTPFQNAVKPVWDKYGPKYQDMIKRIQAIG